MSEMPPPAEGLTPLPVPLTSFIGRDREIATAVGLLGRPDVRLLTLTGPGGIGKTRLALSVMERVRDTAGDGRAWVSLAAVRNPDLVLSTIGRSLNVPEAVDQPPFERVQRFLAGRQMLLVLDNLEHLLDTAAPLIANLLTTCPGLTVLTTSRARLGISGERVMPVAPLDPETARALFASRAEAVDPTFAIITSNASTIDAICDQLDRLPLAIELAAARTNVIPPRALLDRLVYRLDLLSEGPRDAPDRQRNMRAAIEWSHDLLTEPERVLFRRIGVFVGGFTLESAQAVMGDDREALADVSALVAASLVLRVDGAASEPRFTMLETIHEYARERLIASGEEPTIRERHARYMVELAEDLWESPEWPRTERGLARLRPEISNLRLALEWTLQHDPAAALQLAGAPIDYWMVFGYITEGLAWVHVALSATDDVPSYIRARALLAAGRMAGTQGEVESGIAILTHANTMLTDLVAESPNVANTRMLMLSVIFLGDAELANEEMDHARTLFIEAQRLAERYDVPQFATVAIMNLGRIAQESGDLPAAQDLLEDALARHLATSGPIGVAFGHLYLGELMQRRGNRALAGAHLRGAFSIYADAGHLVFAVWTVESLAGLIVTSAPHQVARLLGAAEALAGPNPGPRAPCDAKAYAEILAATRAALSKEAFADAWEEGTRLSLDEIRAEVEALADAITSVSDAPPALAATHGLSPRELEVLRLLAAGRSNSDIAAALCISVPTVKRHVTTILGKLNLPSRSAATAYAHTHALL